MALTKATIIGKIAEKNNCTPKQAKKNFEDMLEIIKETLGIGEDVMISGFGHFKVRHKKARIGRNPKTKVAYEISERIVVTFYPSKVFRKELNPSEMD